MPPSLAWNRIDFRALGLYFACALWVALTFSKALVEISFVGMLVCWFAAKFTGQLPKNFNLPKSVLIPLFLFLGWMLLSAFFSEVPKNSFRGIFKILKQAATFVFVADFLTGESALRRFEKFFVFITWLVFMNGLCQYIVGRDFIRFYPWEESGAGIRLSASFGTYGKYASYLITTIPYLMTLGLLYRNQIKDSSRWHLIMILVPFSIMLLVLTKSRGALLAFCVGIFLILIIRKKFKFAAILVGGILFLGTLAPRNMVIHLDAQLKEQSLIERFYLWDRAVHVIKAKPVLGTGINTYAATHEKYDKTKNWRVRQYYAHNGYLQLAAETGIPCLFFFLWFLGAYFIYSIKSRDRDSAVRSVRFGLLGGILAFLIFALVDTVLQSPQPVITFWFLLGIQAAYISNTLPLQTKR